MPDAAPPAAVVTPAPAAPPTPAPAATPDATPALDGKPPEVAPEAPKWREDWREAIAGEDEKELAWLKRFASPDNYFKANRDTRAKYSAAKPSLSDAPTPEEVTSYRKAYGIPDKPEGYGAELPKLEGVEWSDADKADLAGFAKIAHDQNINPKAFKAMVEGYANLRMGGVAEMREAALNLTIDRRAAVKAQWGADAPANARLANNYLTETLGEEGGPQIAALVLDDGTRLGDHPLFAQLVVTAARGVADDALLADAYHGGDSNAGSFQAQYAAALDKQWTAPKEYHTPEHQKKLLRLRQAVTASANKAA